VLTISACNFFISAVLRKYPAQARDTVWSAIFNPKTGDIIGYLPVDGFLE
jgi:hypothetical protein